MCVSYLIYILNVRKKNSGNISWWKVAEKRIYLFSKGHSLLTPFSLSDTCIILFNANFSAFKLIIDQEFHKKQYPYFHCEVFFLKKNSFLLLWLLLIFLSLAASTVALFTGIFTELAWPFTEFALWKEEKVRMSCNSFLFSFVRFKCYCFCL